nr:MAG TPA: hypothetical protein [Caudoviricetes sp.]
MSSLEERALYINRLKKDNHNYPISYCKQFIIDWENVVKTLNDTKSIVVSDFDNFDVRR